MNALARIGLAALALGALPARAAPPEPPGYRLDNYHPAPTPETVNGRKALTTAEAEALWRDGKTPFVDVASQPPRPEGLAPGTVWIDKPHASIKGAAWLPEVGRGELSAQTETYFRQSLTALTGGDPSRKLVIFCKRDCWMSWNAVKRAQSYGYAQTLWYAEGVEGWREADLPSEIVAPYK